MSNGKVIVNETVIIPQNPMGVPDQNLTVYVPTASTSQRGIAEFDKDEFQVNLGHVKLKPGKYYDKDGVDTAIADAVNLHDSSAEAHEALHNVIKGETAESINQHNTSSTAHQDIREAINDISGPSGTIDTKIAEHNINNNAHQDIREDITDITKVGGDTEQKIAAHNTAPDAHNELLAGIIADMANQIANQIVIHNTSNLAHNDIRELVTDITNHAFTNVTYDSSSGILTFTGANTSVEVDLPLELLIKSGRYDGTAGHEAIILVLANGDEIKIPVQDLISSISKDIEDLLAKIKTLGICDAEADINNKVITFTPPIPRLKAGDIILVKFIQGNNRTEPTNVSIKHGGMFTQFYLRSNGLSVQMSPAMLKMPANYVAYFRVENNNTLMMLNPITGGSNIDDGNVGLGTTWSSQKTQDELIKPEHTTMVVTISKEGAGGYKADYTSSQIINHAQTGVVIAKYVDDVTGETRTYQYTKQTQDRRAVFSKDGYIENGISKQTLIYVDYAGNIEVETKESAKEVITVTATQNEEFASKTGDEIIEYINKGAIVQLKYTNTDTNESRIYDFDYYDSVHTHFIKTVNEYTKITVYKLHIANHQAYFDLMTITIPLHQDAVTYYVETNIKSEHGNTTFEYWEIEDILSNTLEYKDKVIYFDAETDDNYKHFATGRILYTGYMNYTHPVLWIRYALGKEECWSQDGKLWENFGLDDTLTESGKAGDAKVIGDRLSAVDTNIAKNTEAIASNKQDIDYLMGNFTEFQEDATEAYVKDVPATAAPKARVFEIGGKTYKSENLFDISKVISNNLVVSDGEKIIINAGGATTIEAGKPNTLRDYCPSLQPDTKIYLNAKCSLADGTRGIFLYQSAKAIVLGGSATITEADLNSTVRFYTRPNTEVIYSDFIISKENIPYEPYFSGLRDTKCTEVKPMGANLWDGVIKEPNGFYYDDGIFASGNMNYNVYYVPCKPNTEYSRVVTNGVFGGIITYWDKSGNFISGINRGSAKTYTTPEGAYLVKMALEKIQIGKNIMVNRGATPLPYTPYIDLPSLPIPAEVQAQEDYGVGIGKYTNPIKFEGDKTKYIHNAYKIPMANRTWIRYDGYDGFYSTSDNVLIGSREIEVSGYETINDLDFNANKKDLVVTMPNAGFIKIRNRACKTVEQLRTALKNVYAVVAKPNPTETDISQYFPNGGAVTVQGGGSVIFENEHKAPVPSRIGYAVLKGGATQ